MSKEAIKLLKEINPTFNTQDIKSIDTFSGEFLIYCVDKALKQGELLPIDSVSQQRELLNRFLDWQDQDNGMENDKEWNKKYLDRYFKSIL